MWEHAINVVPLFTEEDLAVVAEWKEKGKEGRGLKQIAGRFENEILEVCASFCGPFFGSLFSSRKAPFLIFLFIHIFFPAPLSRPLYIFSLSSTSVLRPIMQILTGGQLFLVPCACLMCRLRSKEIRTPVACSCYTSAVVPVHVWSATLSTQICQLCV